MVFSWSRPRIESTIFITQDKYATPYTNVTAFQLEKAFNRTMGYSLLQHSPVTNSLLSILLDIQWHYNAFLPEVYLLNTWSPATLMYYHHLLQIPEYILLFLSWFHHHKFQNTPGILQFAICYKCKKVSSIIYNINWRINFWLLCIMYHI